MPGLAFHNVKGDPHHGHDYAGQPGPARYAGSRRKAFTLGVAGPVGSGKTALVERLCRELWPEINLAVITNDIYTHEDAEFLSRREVLPLERIVGVQTGGCPHTAIRDDASVNLGAIANLERQFPGLELVIIESGGDNLTAVFSRELADVFIFVIDVAEGDKIPRKGGPGICTQRPARHQQDRPGPARRRRPRRDAPRQPADARRAAVPAHQPAPGRRRRGGGRVGAAAVRITEEDFLTPPEFRGLRLAPTPTGQVGGLRLELVASGGQTRLGDCYQQMPLRVLPPFHFAGEPAALLYLLNPTAGLLDGDAHRIDLVVRAGCRAVVAGQSANRIHPAQCRLLARSSGTSASRPGPSWSSCPARRSPTGAVAITSTPASTWTADARLVWGDVWLPGPVRRGARRRSCHAFDRVVQDVEVRRDGRLVYRDRFAWRGPWSRRRGPLAPRRRPGLGEPVRRGWQRKLGVGGGPTPPPNPLP